MKRYPDPDIRVLFMLATKPSCDQSLGRFNDRGRMAFWRLAPFQWIDQFTGDVAVLAGRRDVWNDELIVGDRNHTAKCCGCHDKQHERFHDETFIHACPAADVAKSHHRTNTLIRPNELYHNLGKRSYARHLRRARRATRSLRRLESPALRRNTLHH